MAERAGACPDGAAGGPGGAVVVGSGVIGLSVAVRLAEAGWPVSVVAAAPWPETTSRVAGAVWHPYLVSGPSVLRWAGSSYRTFAAMAASGVPGVAMSELWELDSREGALAVDRRWVELAGGCRELGPDELPAGPVAWTGGRVLRAPVIDTARYLPYLVSQLASLGVGIRIARLDRLGEAGPAAVVVNCTGLGAAALAGDDSLRPVRGQVVVVANPGVPRSVVSDAGVYAIAHPDSVVLGGTAEHGSSSVAIDPATASSIRARAGALVPGLADAPVLGGRAGLRPWRPSPRLEEDPAPPADVGRLVHCYGHGGAGVTLSWGCAADVAALVGPPPAA